MGLFDRPEQIRAAQAAQRAQNPLQTLAGSLFNLGNTGGNAAIRGLFDADTRSPAEIQAAENQQLLQGLDPTDRNSMLQTVQQLSAAGRHGEALQLAQMIPEAPEAPARAGESVPWVVNGVRRGTKQKDKFGKWVFTKDPGAAGKEEPWLDNNGKVIGVKQTLADGKVHRQRFENSPLVSMGPKEHVKHAFKSFEDLNTKATAAKKLLNSLKFAEESLKGVKTGALTEWKLVLGQLSSSLGVPVNEDILKLEGGQAAFGQMVMDGLSAFPGTISDSERKFVVERFPGLAQTPEGRAEIMRFFRKISEREIKKRDLMIPYLKQASPTLFPENQPDYYTVLGEFEAANPVFSFGTGRKATGDGGVVYEEGADGLWRSPDGSIYQAPE